MPTRTLGLAAALVVAPAGAAPAACAPQSAREQAELAAVIVRGTFETGPLTPARLRVEAEPRC